MSRKEIQEKAWEQMELMLNGEMPRERRRIFLYLPYAAAIALTLGVGSVILFQQQQSNTFTSSNSGIKVEQLKEYKAPWFAVKKEKAIAKKQVLNPQKDFIAQSDADSPLSIVTTGLFIFNDGAQSSEFVTNEEITLPSETIIETQKKSFSSLTENEENKQNEEENTNSILQEQPFLSNQKQQQTLLLTSDIKKSFQPMKDMGLQTNAAIGFVSENFDEYGLRLGLEVKKPLTNNLNAAAGVRYSVYKDDYATTYITDTPEELLDHAVISKMNERNVSRSFIEIPVYVDYEVSQQLKVKSGLAVTYNNNSSESPGFSSSAILNNSYLTDETKQEIGKLYKDESGYLGEMLVGASLTLDKITFDVEATRGFINNQDIDNRNVVGMRVSYRFGQ